MQQPAFPLDTQVSLKSLCSKNQLFPAMFMKNRYARYAPALAVLAAAYIALLTPVIGQPTASEAAASESDPHAIYEQRCALCHQPHAREFARQSLALESGNVIMRSSSAPLDLFLKRHPKGLPDSEARVLLGHFSQMLGSGFIYQDKCVGCHERASTMARLRLFERDGVIKGRYTYRDISEFLRQHGRLTPMEVQTIMNMFKRQLAPGTPSAR